MTRRLFQGSSMDSKCRFVYQNRYSANACKNIIKRFAAGTKRKCEEQRGMRRSHGRQIKQQRGQAEQRAYHVEEKWNEINQAPERLTLFEPTRPVRQKQAD